DTAEVFEFMLRDRHEFRTFKNGIEFLKHFHEEAFDLILLDLVMPEVDGFQTFLKIREVDKDVPVVAITASARAPQRERALKLGFCDYFTKPIMDIDQFRSSVYSHIGKCANPPHTP